MGMTARSSRSFPLLALVLSLLVLGTWPLRLLAEPTGTSTPAPRGSESWILSVGGAVDFPHSNWSPAYRIGIGSRGEFGFPLNADWSAGIGLGFFHYQGNDPSGPVIIDELRVLPLLRYYLSDENFNPYLSGGAGLSAQFAAASGTIAGHLYPDGFLGTGFEVRLADREALFFEVNYSVMLADRVLAQDFEAVIGLRCGF